MLYGNLERMEESSKSSSSARGWITKAEKMKIKNQQGAKANSTHACVQNRR